METLKITNPQGSTYNFSVENYKIYVDAKSNSGKTFLLQLTASRVENGKLATNEIDLPIHVNEQEINDFIKNANTRKLMEFDTHEEMMESVRNCDSNNGSCFETREGKHCFYIYNNRKDS